jgi:uncharacterized BrkB/YihY/UPF0761 family membrane protein
MGRMVFLLKLIVLLSGITSISFGLSLIFLRGKILETFKQIEEKYIQFLKKWPLLMGIVFIIIGIWLIYTFVIY